LRVRLKIYGSVQGVGFRYYVREVAVSSQLNGWVRNLDDGSVEALFDGDEADVNYALEMCKKGPSSASVRRFTVTSEDDSVPISGFRIAF
jgi:acylphosphatase